MSRVPKGFSQAAMRYWRNFVVFAVSLPLLGSAANCCAQQTSKARVSPCFAVHVRVDGRLVEDPKVVTFKTKGAERPVALREGCFSVPADLLDNQAVDILFTVPRNRIYLSGIAPGFFAGSWDVDLEDKRFGKEIVLPKDARVTEVCAVVFHVGEPETVITQTSCRTRF